MKIFQDAPAEAPKKEERPRSPGLLTRILAPFKETKKQVEKRVKAPKSPKKEKQKDEVSNSRLMLFVL